MRADGSGHCPSLTTTLLLDIFAVSFIHSTSPNISQCIHHAPYTAPLLAFVPNSASCRHPSLPRGPRVASLQPFASRWLRPRWPSWWSSYGNMMALRRACCPSSTGSTRRRMSRVNNPPAEPVPPTGVYTATRLTPVHLTAHGGAMEHSCREGYCEPQRMS